MPEARAAQNLALGRRINDLSNARDDSLWALFTPGFVQHTGDRDFGLQQAKLGDEQPFAAIPDARRMIDHETADDAVFVHHWHFEGTVKATGKPIRWEGSSWSRVKDGLIAEAWTFWDPTQLQPRRTS